MTDTQKEDVMIQAATIRGGIAELNNTVIHLASSEISNEIIDASVVKLSTETLELVANLENIIRSKVGM